MSEAYKVRDNEKPYFITLTITNWIDVFTRRIQKEKIVETIRHCQEKKGLIIYSWCLMSNHLHMIIRAEEGYKLTDVIRDLKAYSAKQIIKTIKEEGESRRRWMLHQFEAAARDNLKQQYKVWQKGYHGEEISTAAFMEQKLSYIHQNPVKEGWVEDATAYLYSSAQDYAGSKGLLKSRET